MQKIRLGPAGSPITAKGTINGIEWLKGRLNAMEVQFSHGVRMSMSMAKEVYEKNKNEISLSVHAPYYINLVSEKEQTIKDSRKRILDSVKRAELMNASPVVIHAGYYGKKEKDEVLDSIKKEFRELGKKSKVDLGIETSGKLSAFGQIDELIEISKKTKNCIPVIDFAHIYAKNQGKINYKDIFDNLEELKLKKIHSHFSGIEFTDKGERRHRPISEAGPEFGPLAKEILRRGIDITIICESPFLENDSFIMKKKFESLGYEFK